MTSLKTNDFKNIFSIMTIISLMLLVTYTSILFLPIMARTHVSHNSHQEQQKQNILSQTPSIPTANNQGTVSQTPSIPTANNQGTTLNVPINPNKVVIITFGDGYQSQYSYGKPVLDRYGYKGNFFVTCNRVGTPTKMTWPELVQLYKEGNVI
jgi:hypothetical protein